MYLQIAVLAIVGILLAGVFSWFLFIRPGQIWKSVTLRKTFERDALSDAMPAVELEPYISANQLRAFADSGKGLDLRFIIHNDPRKAYADSVANCGIPQESSYNYAHKPRQQLVDSALIPQLRECVSRFLAPIPRTVPVNILVDVTEGIDDELVATLTRALEEQDVAGRFTQGRDTIRLFASLIFDHDYTVYESWRIDPAQSGSDARQILTEVRAWLTRQRAPLPESTVSVGLLNGLALRQKDDLRGGTVIVVSDGMQLSKSRASPGALDFYRAMQDPRYLDQSRWKQFDRQILSEYGAPCPNLYRARVAWYSPPRERQPIRSALDYWRHFLMVECKAGSFLSRF